MHLLIPFAAPLPDPGPAAAACASLVLPRLQALLARLSPAPLDEGDEWSLSPPHERALARSIGLAGASGRLPWAALQARADGVDVGDLAWGLVTPAHWHLGTEQVSLVDPARLMLDEAGSRALMAAVQELFTSQGWLLRWGGPLRWYVAHESLATLACASLDRVIGRNVDAWLGSDPAARSLRRLQAEAQMLLHSHPLNAAREAAGQLPVNSFWLSGCGPYQAPSATPPTVDERLRAPALAGDWAAWVKAWDTLDEGPLAELLALARQGRPVQLTLCGERNAATWAAPAPHWWLRLLRWAQPQPVARVLQTL
jgi:hypothetical protein